MAKAANIFDALKRVEDAIGELLLDANGASDVLVKLAMAKRRSEELRIVSRALHLLSESGAGRFGNPDYIGAAAYQLASVWSYWTSVPACGFGEYSPEKFIGHLSNAVRQAQKELASYHSSLNS